MSTFELRPWVAGDKWAIYDIANAASTRSASFNRAPIPRETHEQWFTQALAEARPYYAVVDDGTVVGYVRMDDGEVSIAVHPDHRRRGVSRFALEEVARLHRPITAHVFPENSASVRLFEQAGYVRVGTGPNGFLRYELS